MVQQVNSGNPTDQLEATGKFRRILSKGAFSALFFVLHFDVHICVNNSRLVTESNPPIEQVIHCGVIPRFVEFLSAPDPKLQVRCLCLPRTPF
jgi:hypothetical protein